MPEFPTKRTEYWNRSTGLVKTGATNRSETVTDVEHYLLPLNHASLRAFHNWGVADGLSLTAVGGSRGVRVAPGTAVDDGGRFLSLSAGGTAIVDPSVDPDAVVGVATVTVPDDGVVLDTTGVAEPRYVTLTFREVESPAADPLANAVVLLHAPWLRLVPLDEVSDDGDHVVLGKVTFDATGNVMTLTADGRRLSRALASGLSISAPRTQTGATLTVRQGPVAELAAEANGDVALSLLSTAPPRRALTIEQSSGRVVFGVGALSSGPVEIDGRAGWLRIGDTSTFKASLVIASDAPDNTANTAAFRRPALGPNWSHIHHGSTGDWYVRSAANGGKVVLQDTGGRVGIGTSSPALKLDVMESIGLNNRLAISSGDTYLRLNQAGSFTSGVHTPSVLSSYSVNVGGVLGWGNPGFGNLGVAGSGTIAGNLSVGANLSAKYMENPGQSWLRGQVYCGSIFGHWDGSATLYLWGSKIQDLGDGFLQFRSGGGKVYFWDPVTVRGMLYKAGGGFRIDHPTDPAEKYLSHSFVESPEMLNVYAGTVVTDESGSATVQLPDYFEALNRDHRFQLTPLGELSLATVLDEVRDNAFTIRTDRPQVTVSWQVTGVRQDRWAEEHRLRSEEDKPTAERGFYLHPEVFGAPESRALFQTPDESVAPAAPYQPPSPPPEVVPLPEPTLGADTQVASPE